MKIVEELISRYPRLAVSADSIQKALDIMLACYRANGKLLVCGNGGSAADADHIVGELLNKFRKRRKIDPAIAARLPDDLAGVLVGALPAVSLCAMGAALTAISNDVAWDAAFAQQVYGLGNEGDVLVAISTSGNSVNCVNAAHVAKAKGLRVIAMTGEGGGKLAALADCAICVPETETFKIQELHLPVYHALAAAIEETLFD